MLAEVASNIMRTTIDIDGPILDELKKLQKREKKSIGRLISDLLAVSLKNLKQSSSKRPAWTTRSMQAKVDLKDKDALYSILDSANKEP